MAVGVGVAVRGAFLVWLLGRRGVGIECACEHYTARNEKTRFCYGDITSHIFIECKSKKGDIIILYPLHNKIGVFPCFFSCSGSGSQSNKRLMCGMDGKGGFTGSNTSTDLFQRVGRLLLIPGISFMNYVRKYKRVKSWSVSWPLSCQSR